MSLSRDDVTRVARLAELAVAEEELPVLVAQMERIVRFMEQLAQVQDDAGVQPFVAGPVSAPLREDVVRPAALAHPLADMAPAFEHGFFTVPLRGTLEDDA